VKTLVIQSYKTSNTPDWISLCISSVKQWAQQKDYDYRFVGDEIFDLIPDWYKDKTQKYPQISTDLGRLELINSALNEGYERVAWLDADVLIFNPEPFSIQLEERFALSRELWVQPTSSGTLKVYQNVHNAYCIFCPGNEFLDFYRYACIKIISRFVPDSENGLVPQIAGPKFLSALHNMIGFDLVDDIAMASPAILQDISNNTSDALNILESSMTSPAYGANLCASLAKDNPENMMEICHQLLERQSLFPN
jgi:hypothetical protein